MNKIKSNNEFKKVLNKKRALVFVSFQWSGQALLSRDIVEEWIRTWNVWNSGIQVDVYEIDGDDIKDSISWLKEINEKGGYGSLNWLEKGVLKNRVEYVAGAGIAKLSEITKELWG